MPRPRAFETETAVDAAVERFWSTSYAVASTGDLCLDTHLSRSSLYNAFGSKRELYLTCLRRYVEGKNAARRRLTEEPLDGAELLRSIGAVVLEEQWRDASRRACLGINACIEIGSSDAEVAALLEANAAAFDDVIAVAVRRGRADGTLRVTPTDADSLARVVHAALDGLQVRSRVAPDRAAILRDLDALIGLLS